METTTDHLRIKNLYYNSADECRADATNYVNSNKRYFNFCQTLFHAGDIEQFENYSVPDKKESRDNLDKLKEIDIEKYREFYEKYDYSLYKDISSVEMYNTFQYIFYKFKKGIYVKIENNYLKVFLPFSNANYINEWSDRISIDGDIEKFFKKVSELEGRTFKPKKINYVKKHWYANNFLIRSEYPINEGDTGVCQYRYILEEICKEYRVPDVEFFINRRDFPILKKDLTEPYEDIYDSTNFPIKTFLYEKYLPIFSMTGNERYSDLLFPTHDDISRISKDKYFNKDCKDYSIDESIRDLPLEEKIPKAVFRGSSTGKGISIDTNPRLKIASMQKKYSRYLDVGITKWNCRPRKIMGQKNLQYIDKDNLPFDIVDKLDYSEQMKYRYIVHIEGHTESYRLSTELNMGSVILMVKSEYQLWYSHLLQPWVHFVPVKSDLSNLIQRIKWCEKNLEKCREIVENSKLFYKNNLCKKGVKEYIVGFLYKIKNITGSYVSPENPIIKKKEYIKQLLDGFIQKKISKNSRNFTESNKYTKSFINLYGDYQCDRLLQVYIMIHKNTLVVKDVEIIKQNQNSCIKMVKFPKILPSSLSFVIKTGCNKSDILHESFVGLFGINKVCEIVPTFNYTYTAQTNDCYIVQKYRKGITLFEYISQTEKLDIQFIFTTICHILLSIKVAQNVCGFIHNDLFPWNIILEPCDTERLMVYPVSVGECYSITIPKGGYMPVIIDYNKSGIIYNREYFSNMNPYKNSFFQDALTLLISITNIILNTKKMEKNELDSITKVCSIICGTEYYPEKYINIKNFKVFLKTAHKYSFISDCKKGELDSKSPIDLVKHITFIIDIPLMVCESCINFNTPVPINILSPFILEKSISQHLMGYKKYFYSINPSKLLEYSNIAYLHYSYQKTHLTVQSAEKYYRFYVKGIAKNDLEKYKNILLEIDVIIYTLYSLIDGEYKKSIEKLRENNPKLFDNPDKTVFRENLGLVKIEKIMSENRKEFFEHRRGFDKNVYLNEKFIKNLSTPVYIQNVLSMHLIYIDVYSSTNESISKELRDFLKNYFLENHIAFYKYNSIKMALQ